MVANMQYSGGYYYGMNSPYSVQLTVPISVSCPNSGTLWAVGSVYDTVTNTNLGSNSLVLTSNNGYYSGQLVLPVPMSVIGHQLEVQIQVYNAYTNGQYSDLVATSSSTVTVNPSGYYPPTSYSYYNGYANGYYNGYYYYYGYPAYYYYYYGYPYYYYYNSPPSSCSNYYSRGYLHMCGYMPHH